MRARLALALAGAALLPAARSGGGHTDEGRDRPPRSSRRASIHARAGSGGADGARRQAGAGIRARPARCAASRGSRPPRARALDRERGRRDGRRQRHGRVARTPRCALHRSRLRASDPARGCRHDGARHRRQLGTRALGPRNRRHRGHGGDARHRRRSHAPGARGPLSRRRQQLVRPLWRAHDGAGGPARPRDAGHGRHRRRQRHRHGARRALHRGARLQRRGREHRQRRPPRVPVAARSRRQPCDRRRARCRQCVVGRTACNLRPGVRARPPGLARGAHPAGLRRRERRSRGAVRHLARQSPGSVRRRRGGGRHGDRAVLEHRTVALRWRPVPVARRRRHRHPLDGSLRLRRNGPRGHVVRSAARRRRTRVAAAGRPAARGGRPGEPADAECTRSRHARRGRDLRRRFARRRRGRAPALADARLQSPEALGRRVRRFAAAHPRRGRLLCDRRRRALGRRRSRSRRRAADGRGRRQPRLARRGPRGGRRGPRARRSHDRIPRARRGRELELPHRCSP